MLAMLCGGDYGLLELITATIKEITASGNWFMATTIKTEAAYDECGRKWTVAEKIKSAISVVSCPGGDYIAINTVSANTPCMLGATEIPCYTADMSFEEKFSRIFAYTTDGEWAIRVGVIDASQE